VAMFSGPCPVRIFEASSPNVVSLTGVVTLLGA
jgi:hypothetical protein